MPPCLLRSDSGLHLPKSTVLKARVVCVKGEPGKADKADKWGHVGTEPGAYLTFEIDTLAHKVENGAAFTRLQTISLLYLESKSNTHNSTTRTLPARLPL